MVFDYSRLLGRIKEKGYTQAQLAPLAKMNPGTLSMKLNNLATFRQLEIADICAVLDIPHSEIGAYFFVFEVRKNTNEATTNE